MRFRGWASPARATPSRSGRAARRAHSRRDVAADRARLRHLEPEHVSEVSAFADAAVVGSAIVQVIARAAAEGRDVPADVERFVLAEGR